MSCQTVGSATIKTVRVCYFDLQLTDLNTQLLVMNCSYLLLFCGLSQLLLVTANPPNPCADPSNPGYNSAVIPLRTSIATSMDLYFPVGLELNLVNGCYLLRIPPSGFCVFQRTITDTTPYALVVFSTFLINTCTGSSTQLFAGQSFSYQTLLTVSNNVDRVSLTGMFVDAGTAYTPEGSTGFILSTSPVNFEGHSPAEYKTKTRSVNRTGSQCRIVYNTNTVQNKPTSTSAFTITITVDGNDPIDFVVPSNVTAAASNYNEVHTYHQCTCSVI